MKMSRSMLPRQLTMFLLGIPFILITILVFITPFLIPTGSLTDLSGSVGVIDNRAEFDELPFIPRMVYLVGDFECHQISSRSYYLNGNQMPVCARDVGIIVGITAGLLFLAYVNLIMPYWALIAGLLPMGVDGALQLFTSYESTNIVRLATGLTTGVVIALAISHIRHEICEIRRMKRNKRKSIPNGPQFNP